tara:strand:+ start:662 stop:886 length:225 start_codon:yes stop_codon:yes gene_type:complete
MSITSKLDEWMGMPLKEVVEALQAHVEKELSERIAEGQTPVRSLKEIQQDFEDAMSRLNEIEAKALVRIETNKE